MGSSVQQYGKILDTDHNKFSELTNSWNYHISMNIFILVSHCGSQQTLSKMSQLVILSALCCVEIKFDLSLPKASFRVIQKSLGKLRK